MDNQDLLRKTLKSVVVMLAGSTLFLGALGGLTVSVIGYATSASSPPSRDESASSGRAPAPAAEGAAKRAADGRSGTQI